MKVVKRNRYIANCGKGFWNKNSCTAHEENCKCWTNPDHRTCKTCKFGKKEWDSNGMEDDPAYLHRWKQWTCSNPKYMHEIHFRAAHETAPDLNIGCAVWEHKI